MADDPVFVEKFVRIVGGEHRKGHFPDIWVPHKPQKPCLLSPDAVDVVAISTASGAPDVHTISDLQQALTLLSTAIMVPKRGKSSRVSKCTQESSPTELPAHRRKQSCSPN